MSFPNLNVDPSNEGGRRDQGSQKPEEVTDPARLNIIVVNIFVVNIFVVNIFVVNIIVVNISMSIDLNDISQSSHRWTVENHERRPSLVCNGQGGFKNSE